MAVSGAAVTLGLRTKKIVKVPVLASVVMVRNRPRDLLKTPSFVVRNTLKSTL